MLNVGLSTFSFELTDENFKLLVDAGITHLEISRDWLSFHNIDFAEAKRLCEKYNVKLWSVHLPFADPANLDIASVNEEIRQKTLNLWYDNIVTGAQAGARIFVVHPSSEPMPENEEERRRCIEASKKSLKQLADFAAKYDSVIAVEDLPRSCLGRNSAEIAELISADSRLRVCFDTNHLLIEDNLKFIENLGDKIITLHVSDYDFTNEKHWLPGEGKIDWQALYKKLQAVGYNGPFLYEISLFTPKTIQRSRDLTFKDFNENANQIFNNLPLTLKD